MRARLGVIYKVCGDYRAGVWWRHALVGSYRRACLVAARWHKQYGSVLVLRVKRLRSWNVTRRAMKVAASQGWV